MISFERAFYHLWLADDFEKAIKVTLGLGGNTDSNCCVVGGLLGAYHGIHKLHVWKKKIDNWTHRKKELKKREPYQAKHYDIYVQFLFKHALHPNPKKFQLLDPTSLGEGFSEEFVL